jgi:choline kinase
VKEALGSGRDFGARLQFLYNPDYHGGNAISLSRARDWASREPIVLCMGDHLMEPELVRRLLDKRTVSDTLCVDYTPAEHHQVAEATKVSVDVKGFIRDIGKEVVHWNAMDTGVFLITENFFRALDRLVPHLGTNIEISDVIRFMISHGKCFDTCDVSSCFWADVDTEQDLMNIGVNLK